MLHRSLFSRPTNPSLESLSTKHLMQGKSIPWRFVCTLAVVGAQALFILSANSSGQEKSEDKPAPTAPTPGTELGLASEFDEQASKLREHLTTMRTKWIDFHVAKDPAEIKRLKQEWLDLTINGRKIFNDMVKVAVTELQKNPKPDSTAALFLGDVAARNADSDRFDGMLEAITALEQCGYKTEQFDLCVGLTAAAANDFERAAPHLKIAIENIGKAFEQLAESKKVGDEQKQELAKKMMETIHLLEDLGNVEVNKALLEKENKLREADAAGEPLPQVLIKTTKGDFVVELYENQVPNTVANFISLCEKDFYNDLPFHRVITHFMAQTGCPNHDGTGDPGYSIRTELDENHRYFFRGTLGMALSQTPDSGGSQFYICFLPRAYLNGKYVAFGRVIEGMNVLSDIEHIDPDDKQSQGKEPPDKIISTKVLRKRNHPYVPVTIPVAPKPK